MRLSFDTVFFRYIVGLSVVTLLLVAGLYAYLGTFSRYGGDDYCEAARIRQSSPIAAVFERYFDEDWPRATMRYSNLLFVGFSESLGRYNIPVTIVSMILLWFAGTVWGTLELRRFLKIDWPFSVDLFLGLTFGFFSLRQAPNLFETVYWRSAMMTHFAPLVFGLFLFSFVIRQARSSPDKSPSLAVLIFVLGATFIIAGFSEPPTTTLLTVTPLLIGAVGLWAKPPARRLYLTLLAAVFMGALMGLLAMLLSPASAEAAQEKALNVFQLLVNSFVYGYQFILDTLRTQPLPMFLAMLISLLFMWLYGQIKPFEFNGTQKKLAGIVILAAPFLAWLLIAAGFSPSVYGQSFPVERMRFLARAIVIAVFMLEGSLFGLLLGHVNWPATPRLGQAVVALVFAVMAIGYPLRTAASLIRVQLPEYSTRAEKWDARDASIRAMKNEGERDLTVPFLSDEIIQDLGDRREFRLNRCASVLYGVDSILARTLNSE